ncbi:Phosphoprotein phosphatase [Mycena indigotica]|uniref:Mitochondrial import inner membrane translocase subunit TIM50 n=1 Tax=Mycena indigotica TaxID=2126181 RepID=A0A8H6W343_9AGAR|nr:Phosphoprotein phosphatase [Mycena indigotica]KAF7303839.1 Phosphoprotein phosphatase [Mycena indigotica]
MNGFVTKMTIVRKLLILDLNGTLLLRSKRSHGVAPPNGGPRPRTVHRRPYLSSFREYLFHPTTKEWLDTMVWSSAQPNSVTDMVHQCFGEQKSHFVAIWARDTLDLPPELYHQKTPTTKDLVTPWKVFPLHNAQTTLLLDDSARKAHRHPFNHVCVSEYSPESRRRDLSVLNASKGPSQLLSKIRKQRPQRNTVDAAEIPRVFDEILLAVVGILETLKSETDVAGWIKNGGLVDPTSQSPPFEQSSSKSTPDALATQLSQLTMDTPNESSAFSRWFEQNEALHHWAQQGRDALAALEIEIVAGVHE